jgi:hypothetical protein
MSIDGGAGTNSGVVKVFDTTTGLQVQKLTSPSLYMIWSNFGRPVQTECSSGRILIASAGYDDSGHVHIYDETSALTWTETVTLRPAAATSGDGFYVGSALGISGGIGSTVIFASKGDWGAGGVFTWREEGVGNWVEGFMDNADVDISSTSNYNYEYFGYAVAVRDGSFLIGAYEAGVLYSDQFDCIDYCDPSPCNNAMPCINGIGNYSCDCDDYFDAVCLVLNECSSDPCANNGSCTDTANTQYECNCTGTGYEGATCTVLSDDCAIAPCTNGDCVDGNMSFTCNCTGTAYEGELCEVFSDDCAPDPCTNGLCVDGNQNFTCDCTGTDYEGPLCADLSDPCIGVNCGNNGTCVVANNSVALCSCDSGYTGLACESDIDDCASSPCDPIGTSLCVDVGANLVDCDCNDGYSGDLCEVEPACTSSPCQNNGTCTDVVVADFECTCVTGFTGDLCQSDIDDCASSPCDATGTSLCVDIGTNLVDCKCHDGYSGDWCEVANPVFSSSAVPTFEVVYRLNFAGTELANGTDFEMEVGLAELITDNTEAEWEYLNVEILQHNSDGTTDVTVSYYSLLSSSDIVMTENLDVALTEYGGVRVSGDEVYTGGNSGTLVPVFLCNMLLLVSATAMHC